VETVIHFFPGLFDGQYIKKKSIYLKQTFCNTINVFTVTIDQFNTSLLNKMIKNR